MRCRKQDNPLDFLFFGGFNRWILQLGYQTFLYPDLVKLLEQFWYHRKILCLHFSDSLFVLVNFNMALCVSVLRRLTLIVSSKRTRLSRHQENVCRETDFLPDLASLYANEGGLSLLASLCHLSVSPSGQRGYLSLIL